MKQKFLAVGLCASLLSGCSQSEDPVATQDKLMLVYQSLLNLDLDTAMSDPTINFVQGDGYSTLYVGKPQKDPYVVEISTIRDDKTKCQFYVKLLNGSNYGSSSSLIGTYTLDSSNMYLSKPQTALNESGWVIGQVPYEPAAIDAYGDMPLQRLGAKLGNVSGDAGNNKALWEGRISSLRKHCPGKG